MSCAACGVAVSEEVESMTRRLLAESALGSVRAGALSELYGGQLPEVFCSACFNLNMSNLNSVLLSKQARQ